MLISFEIRGEELGESPKSAMITQKCRMQIQIPDLWKGMDGLPEGLNVESNQKQAAKVRASKGSAGILNEMASQDQHEWRRAILSFGWGCDYAKLCT